LARFEISISLADGFDYLEFYMLISQSRQVQVPSTTQPENIRVAWLFPSLEFANYWHPVFHEFTQHYPQTTVYTGLWPGFTPRLANQFRVKVVGKMRFICLKPNRTGYGQGFILASPKILIELLRDRPQLIFTSGFSLWTMIALVLKIFIGWRVIIAYEGSSPGVDYRGQSWRLLLRRTMVRMADHVITNSQSGKNYLQQVLQVPPRQILARPYQVPDVQTLLPQMTQSAIAAESQSQVVQSQATQSQSDVMTFLFTGQIIPRKGLHFLLEACRILKQQGYENYRLLIAGDGENREALQAVCEQYAISPCVTWLGWVAYEQLGQHFQAANVFILPTLEDTWGMVILEAMALGKPVFCSQYAGASELIRNGKNGQIFDPYDPETIATSMRWAIDHPAAVTAMGQCAQDLISQHTPQSVALFLRDFVAETMEQP
jgi:glycosyltransferase involved in cell wall biosynthesis